VVIGSGQTGLMLSTRLAEAGHDVLLVESSDIGGSYFYSFDEPKKLLQQEAQSYSTQADIIKQSPSLLKEVHTKIRRNTQQKILGQIKKIKQKLSKFPNLKIMYGQARFTSKNLLEINSETEKNLVGFEHCLLATGKGQLSLPSISGLSAVDVMYQHNSFFGDKYPQSLAIIGFTPRNLEVAEIYAGLGSQVVIFEKREPSVILREIDTTCLNFAIQSLLEKGVEFLFEAEAVRVIARNDKIRVEDSEAGYHDFDSIYVEAQESFQDNLNLSSIGINSDSRGVSCSNTGQTSQRNIYALGQCSATNRPGSYYSNILNLLEKFGGGDNSKSRALVLMNNVSSFIQGELREIPFPINTITLSQPVSTVGLSFRESASRYGSQVKYEVLTKQDQAGFIKIIYNEQSGQLLGSALGGQICTNLLAIAINAGLKNWSYRDYRSFLNTLGYIK